jgi:hypothetical protein
MNCKYNFEKISFDLYHVYQLIVKLLIEIIINCIIENGINKLVDVILQKFLELTL